MLVNVAGPTYACFDGQRKDTKMKTDSLIGKMFVFEKLKIASVIGLSQSSERHLGGRWS